MTAEDLRAFEAEVARRFETREIHAPIHLSGGNEQQLVELFNEIEPDSWIFSTWRSHLHALLHGVPPDLLMADIVAGKSLFLHYPTHRFFTSAIVGGILPIACGVAAAGGRVWCFLGDMAASGGAFHDAQQYAVGHDLPITFVVEDNGFATETPTAETWGHGTTPKTRRYRYTRTYPHVGVGKFIEF